MVFVEHNRDLGSFLLHDLLWVAPSIQLVPFFPSHPRPDRGPTILFFFPLHSLLSFPRERFSNAPLIYFRFISVPAWPSSLVPGTRCVLPRSPAAFVTIRIGWFIISVGTTIQFTETPDCLSFVPDDLSNGEAIYWTHCVNPHGSMTTSPVDSLLPFPYHGWAFSFST